MIISFMGGKQAGIVGLLTILSKGHEIIASVGYDDEIKSILKALKIYQFKSTRSIAFKNKMLRSDALICVHGREILRYPKYPKHGCWNVHPYLSKYRGVNPIGRALKNKDYDASVGIHRMSDKIDEGYISIEKRKKVKPGSVEEVYNQLYPLYAQVIIDLLSLLQTGIDMSSNIVD